MFRRQPGCSCVNETKRHSAVGIRRRCQVVAMSFDDRTADRQPHAKPFRLRGVKRAKELVDLIARQQGTTIGNRYFDLSLRIATCTDRDPTRWRFNETHRF